MKRIDRKKERNLVLMTVIFFVLGILIIGCPSKGGGGGGSYNPPPASDFTFDWNGSSLIMENLGSLGVPSWSILNSNTQNTEVRISGDKIYVKKDNELGILITVSLNNSTHYGVLTSVNTKLPSADKELDITNKSFAFYEYIHSLNVYYLD